MVRLITWNVARRARTLVAQAAAVGAREPDVLALQEVTARTWPLWRAAWDEAELGVVPGLRDLGYADAFRALHGYASREPSWAWRHGGGWRLDHVFCSAALEPAAARYHHAWRLEGLSDHSALEVDMTPDSSPPSGGR